MNDHDFLKDLKIAKPCPARWEEMRGDERKRSCDYCQKNVYNFAAMTAAEGAALIRATEGRLCGRLFRRRDGTVLTADCPVGAALYWKKAKLSVCAAAAVAVFMVGSALAVAQGREQGASVPRLQQQYAARFDQVIFQVKVWLGMYRPRAIAGDLAVPMGKIAVPPVCTTPPKPTQE